MMPDQPCACELERNAAGAVCVIVHHDHSDFEPFACVEFDCDCEGWRPPGADTEPAANDAQAPPDARYRSALTIPAQALDFSAQRITQAADHLDDILRHHTTTGNPDQPIAVCGLADLLEATWPDGIDPLDVLAMCIRRLQDATAYRPRTLLGAVRRIGGQR